MMHHLPLVVIMSTSTLTASQLISPAATFALALPVTLGFSPSVLETAAPAIRSLRREIAGLVAFADPVLLTRISCGIWAVPFAPDSSLNLNISENGSRAALSSSSAAEDVSSALWFVVPVGDALQAAALTSRLTGAFASDAAFAAAFSDTAALWPAVLGTAASLLTPSNTRLLRLNFTGEWATPSLTPSLPGASGIASGADATQTAPDFAFVAAVTAGPAAALLALCGGLAIAVACCRRQQARAVLQARRCAHAAVRRSEARQRRATALALAQQQQQQGLYARHEGGAPASAAAAAAAAGANCATSVSAGAGSSDHAAAAAVTTNRPVGPPSSAGLLASSSAAAAVVVVVHAPSRVRIPQADPCVPPPPPLQQQQAGLEQGWPLSGPPVWGFARVPVAAAATASPQDARTGSESATHHQQHHHHHQQCESELARDEPRRSHSRRAPLAVISPAASPLAAASAAGQCQWALPGTAAAAASASSPLPLPLVAADSEQRLQPPTRHRNNGGDRDSAGPFQKLAVATVMHADRDHHNLSQRADSDTLAEPEQSVPRPVEQLQQLAIVPLPVSAGVIAVSASGPWRASSTLSHAASFSVLPTLVLQ
jgi:hypothetical protein